jgi:hypothetical protein
MSQVQRVILKFIVLLQLSAKCNTLYCNTQVHLYYLLHLVKLSCLKCKV